MMIDHTTDVMRHDADDVSRGEWALLVLAFSAVAVLVGVVAANI